MFWDNATAIFTQYIAMIHFDEIDQSLYNSTKYLPDHQSSSYIFIIICIVYFNYISRGVQDDIKLNLSGYMQIQKDFENAI